MRTFDAVIERDPDSGLYVGRVPGWPAAHSLGCSVAELERNLRDLVEMLLEEGGAPSLKSEFVGVRTIRVAP